jgi:transposase
VFNRFDRSASKGIWQRLFESLRQDCEDEWHSIDSTINRAHQHAAGPSEHGIGGSRGGLTTKVHLVVDALGLPLVFEISEGQQHDSRPASELVERARLSCILAEKAYDSDARGSCRSTRLGKSKRHRAHQHAIGCR